MAINWNGSREELLKFLLIEGETVRLSYHPSFAPHRQGMIVKKGTPTLTIAGEVYYMRSLYECLGIATKPPVHKRYLVGQVTPTHIIPMQEMTLVKKDGKVLIYANDTHFCIVTKDNVKVQQHTIQGVIVGDYKVIKAADGTVLVAKYVQL